MKRTHHADRPPTRVVAYLRLSKASDDLYGLEAQLADVTAYCAAQCWPAPEVLQEVASGGSLRRREVLRGVLESLRPGHVLVAARMDRIARSLPDFVRISERSEKFGWKLVTLDMPLDPGTAAGKFVRSMLAVVAEFERGLISERTADALEVTHANGTAKRKAVPDEVRELIVDMREQSLSFGRIAAWLNDREFPTSRGGAAWYAGTVRKICRQEGVV